MFDEYLKYTDGKLTTKEREDFFKNMLENEGHSNVECVKQAEKALLYSQLMSDEEDVEAGLCSYELFHKKRQKRTLFHLFKREYFRYAAVAMIAFATGGFSLWITKEATPEELVYNEIEVPAGQRSKLTLSDGTVVWLHSNSKFCYPAIFQNKERNVSLKGEAFFEVTSDKNKPFIVNLERQVIKVLGTEFNVSAYQGDLTSVALIKGAVEVTDKKKASSIKLKPGHRVTFDTHTMSLDSLYNTDFLLWKKGIYSFDGCTFEEITRQLEHYYGVKSIFLNQKFKSYRFTAKFRQQDGLDNIMNLLKASKSFNFKKNDSKNEIYIY